MFFAVVRFSPTSQETAAAKRKAEAKNICRIRKSRSLIFWLRPKAEAQGRAVKSVAILLIKLKLRGFLRIDLPCIDICYNALPIQYLWFFKARGHTSGAPGSRKKACSSGLIELNILVRESVFRVIWGIFDQGSCRETRWKSFISPASPITEPNGDCHKCLNGGLLQPDSQTNPEGQGKSPKFE